MTTLLVATTNKGKQREIAQILADLPIQLLSASDLMLQVEVEENGDSYAANALLKATTYCQLTGLPTLADDSGLEVRALNNRPGLYSARYAGKGASNPERWSKLLAELNDVPADQRGARFVCVVALVAPGKGPFLAEGVCEGTIAAQPIGEGGFGYDPLFYLPEFNCTMAQLRDETKNKVSHRALAVAKAAPVLRGWFGLPLK